MRWTSWTSLEPKDDMEDKDRPGDDALQEEQEPCRQADHGCQTFPSCTESPHVPQYCFLYFFLALGTFVVRTMSMHLALRAVIAMAAVCHPKWEPCCNLTASFPWQMHEFYAQNFFYFMPDIWFFPPFYNNFLILIRRWANLFGLLV